MQLLWHSKMLLVIAESFQTHSSLVSVIFTRGNVCIQEKMCLEFLCAMHSFQQ